MRLVLQRVAYASVRVGDETVGAIGPGLMVLVGAGEGDTEAEAHRLAEKTAELRIFSDAEGRFNLSLLDSGGEALVISQFTLYADTRRGRRPGFAGAAAPDIAEPLVGAYAARLAALGIKVAQGRFGAHMHVTLENDGPVTILIDSADLDKPRRG